MKYLSIHNHEAIMTSLEIAELVESRHADVKRSIERLAEKGVIRLPPLAFSENINNLGFKVNQDYYLFKGERGKRDSIIVIAQLCPKFTARLVDRWQELESKSTRPQSLPEALRAYADEIERNQHLENKILLDAPKVEFAELVGEADGVLIGSYAKTIGFGQNRLFTWLRDNKILNKSGSKYNQPRDEYIHRGYFTSKVIAINKYGGGVEEKFTTKITGKGQIWLTKKLKEAELITK